MTAKGRPIVDDQTSAEDVGASIHGSRDDGHLQQRGQLVLLRRSRFRVHEAALIREGTVRSDEDVSGDRLSEYFDLEDVGEDLLGLSVEVGVYEGDVVVASYHVAQSGQSLFHALDSDLVREGVSDLLQFLICRRIRHQEAVSVANAESERWEKFVNFLLKF